MITTSTRQQAVTFRPLTLDPGAYVVMVETPERVDIVWDPEQVSRDYAVIIAWGMGADVR